MSSHHRKTRLPEDDAFDRGQVAIYAFLVAIAAVGGLLRVMGVLH
jgi:hypothetical protein